MDDGRWSMAAGSWPPDMVAGVMRSGLEQMRLAQTAGLEQPSQVQDAVCFVSLDVVRLGVIRSDSCLSRGADWTRRAT
jgi:hypothetical protein